jgi:dTDP-4-dehydrorhamnose reductase
MASTGSAHGTGCFLADRPLTTHDPVMSETKRLIVTGAHGFVAGSVIAQAGADWEVHPISRGTPLLQRPGLVWHQFDPLETAKLAQLFEEVCPQAVVHTAALADIDFCQNNPDLARRVNVGLTREIADLCGKTKAKLVFCSTDSVFDGENAPYAEDDAVGPVNFYAETKVQAEEIVMRLGLGAVVARLSLVTGLPVLGAGNSFVTRLVASLRAGQRVAVPAQEIRTPIDVVTLGRALLELAKNQSSGWIHLAGNDRLNRLELSRMVAARLGLPKEWVVPSGSTQAAGRARRPRDVSLNNQRAQAALKTPMQRFEDGLSLVLQSAQNLAS